MAVRSTINQKTQWGLEVTHGTAAACNKVLASYIWTLGEKPTTKQFRGSGRQYPGTSALPWKEGTFKASGPVADAANITAAYARADALLQPSGNPLRNTDNTLACFREQALEYGEVRQDGTLWMHHGGLYRVEV